MKTICLTLIVGLFFAASQSASGQWVFKRDMPTARSNTCSVVLNGQIYVIGGRDSNGNVLDLVQVYDPQTDSWSSFPSLKKARENAAAAVFDGKIVVVGGSSNEAEQLKKVEFFDTAENRWDSFEDLEDRRDGVSAGVLNGHLYAIGGFGGAEADPQFLNSVESVDSFQGSWHVSQDWQLNFPSASSGLVQINDIAYVLGGFSPFGPLNFVQRYSEASGSSQIASLQTARGGLAAGVLNGDIVVAGGRGPNDQVLDSVELYNFSVRAWIEGLPMNVPREFFVMETVDNRVYAIGGLSLNGAVLASVESGMNLGAVTSVTTPDPEVPEVFVLRQNYPNPFNAGTVIDFEIRNEQSETVQLSIFNLRGQEVRRLLQRVLPAGEYKISWDGNDENGTSVPSGIYVYMLKQGGLSRSKRMLYLK